MTGATWVELTLPPAPTAARDARRAVREAVLEAGAAELADSAGLATSELVTNAVVHAGTQLGLRILAERSAIRVEITDASPHLPVRRPWAETAGTGRGLIIVEEHTDRWGATRTDGGKVVWFEIGHVSGSTSVPPTTSEPTPDTLTIALHQMPLLMHWAWQEHASTLLREYLLYALEREEDALTTHAVACDALRLLEQQVPRPQLPDDPGALMASSVEPGVTATLVELGVPSASVTSFAVLDHLLTTAVAAARAGHLLGAPTQPEVIEMREWLCHQVARQAAGDGPTAWVARTGVRGQVDTDSTRALVRSELAGSDEPLVATDEACVIVAVTPSVVEVLGYDDASQLLGHRILVVIPARFHQAHVAGLTMHATNGRDVLLDQWLTVPVVRADATEIEVQLRVTPRRLLDDTRVFVAQLRLPVS